MTASLGSGYARVALGACNEFWTGAGVPGSGPFAPFGDFSDAWPADGFVTDLDVWLDPEWTAGPDGVVLIYASSIRLLDQQAPGDTRYFFVPVVKDGSRLVVAGNPVTDEGWYTFRHTFTDTDGGLSVAITLLRDDEELFTFPITTTGLSGEDPSSFPTSNVGTGTAWFVSIAQGLALPIDEQELFLLQ